MFVLVSTVSSVSKSEQTVPQIEATQVDDSGRNHLLPHLQVLSDRLDYYNVGGCSDGVWSECNAWGQRYVFYALNSNCG